MRRSFEDDLAAFKEAHLEELSAEEEAEARLGLRELIAIDAEEFYNKCHEPGTGRWCVGPDGPGRLRENNARAEKVLGRRAPQYLKNLLSRKVSKAQKTGAEVLPEKAPAYMKKLLKRRIDKSYGIEE